MITWVILGSEKYSLYDQMVLNRNPWSFPRLHVFLWQSPYCLGATDRKHWSSYRCIIAVKLKTCILINKISLSCWFKMWCKRLLNSTLKGLSFLHRHSVAVAYHFQVMTVAQDVPSCLLLKQLPPRHLLIGADSGSWCQSQTSRVSSEL